MFWNDNSDVCLNLFYCSYYSYVSPKSVIKQYCHNHLLLQLVYITIVYVKSVLMFL